MNIFKSILKKQLIKLCKRVGNTAPILLDFSNLDDAKSASLLLDTMRQSRLLIPQEIKAPSNQKVFVIAPHPDDEVIGMGGTMAQMVKNGCDVSVISLTFGDDENATAEAKKSADHLGYKFIDFLEFSPKNIPINDETIHRLASNINTVSPQIIFLPFMLDDHDDHRRASEIILRTYEKNILKNYKDITIFAYQVYTAMPLNTVINISEDLTEKLDAISKYNSRFRQRDWAHFAKGLSAMNVRYLPSNTKAQYAEVFLSTTCTNYMKMCDTYFNADHKCYVNPAYN